MTETRDIFIWLSLDLDLYPINFGNPNFSMQCAVIKGVVYESVLLPKKFIYTRPFFLLLNNVH